MTLMNKKIRLAHVHSPCLAACRERAGTRVKWDGVVSGGGRRQEMGGDCQSSVVLIVFLFLFPFLLTIVVVAAGEVLWWGERENRW